VHLPLLRVRLIVFSVKPLLQKLYAFRVIIFSD